MIIKQNNLKKNWREYRRMKEVTGSKKLSEWVKQQMRCCSRTNDCTQRRIWREALEGSRKRWRRPRKWWRAEWQVQYAARWCSWRDDISEKINFTGLTKKKRRILMLNQHKSQTGLKKQSSLRCTMVKMAEQGHKREAMLTVPRRHSGVLGCHGDSVRASPHRPTLESTRSAW